MSFFRSRARKIAFGDFNEDLSDASSTRSSIRSSVSASSKPAIVGHSSSISEACTCRSQEKAVHVTPRRTNRVRHINRNQPFEHFVEALEADGCVVVEDFVSPQISQRVQIAEDIPLSTASDERQSRSLEVDIHALVRESLVADSLYQALASHFLTLETLSWRNKQAEMNASKPRLSSSGTRDLNNDIGPATAFSRADSTYHVRHAASTRYDYQSRKDVSLALFLPELDSLSASIPVQTIPGSHLWDDQKPNVTKGVKEVELRSGEALILLGRLYHQVCATDSEQSGTTRAESGARRERLMHEVWMCGGIYRSEIEIEREDAEA